MLNSKVESQTFIVWNWALDVWIFIIIVGKNVLLFFFSVVWYSESKYCDIFLSLLQVDSWKTNILNRALLFFAKESWSIKDWKLEEMSNSRYITKITLPLHIFTVCCVLHFMTINASQALHTMLSLESAFSMQFSGQK